MTALGKATEFPRQEASFHEKECVPGLRTAALKDWKQLLWQHFSTVLGTKNLVQGNCRSFLNKNN